MNSIIAFLKPTRMKIVLIPHIFILGFGALVLVPYHGMGPNSLTFNEVIFLFLFYPILWGLRNHILPGIYTNFFAIIIQALYLYFISCVYVGAYGFLNPRLYNLLNKTKSQVKKK